MDIKELDIKALERLLGAAAREQQRRQQRRPAHEVRVLLHVAAAEAGYLLADVFPELPIAPMQGLSVPAAEASGAAPSSLPVARKAAAPAPPPVAAASVAAPAPVADATSTARAIARVLAATPHSDVVAVALAAVQTKLQLDERWSLFHAGMEEASKRNWVHFRGNDRCVLTDDGAKAAASSSEATTRVA